MAAGEQGVRSLNRAEKGPEVQTDTPMPCHLCLYPQAPGRGPPVPRRPLCTWSAVRLQQDARKWPRGQLATVFLSSPAVPTAAFPAVAKLLLDTARPGCPVAPGAVA